MVGVEKGRDTLNTQHTFPRLREWETMFLHRCNFFGKNVRAHFDPRFITTRWSLNLWQALAYKIEKIQKGHSMYDNVTTQCRCFLIQKLLGPVQTYPFLFEHGYFFSGLAHRPHISGENGHRKRIFSKTLSNQGGNFCENAGFLSTCGRTKTEDGFQIRWCHISYTVNPLLSTPGGWFGFCIKNLRSFYFCLFQWL